MRVTSTLIFSLLLLTSIWGQDGEIQRDANFDDDIGMVELRVYGLYLSAPMIPLNGGAKLLLSFDDLYEEQRNFRYEVLLCNSDWTLSELDVSDYINGFNNDYFDDVEFCFNTKTKFSNNQLLFPNDDLRFTASGNYILRVYDEDTDELVFTRRFMVAEDQLVVNAEFKAPTKVQIRETDQEISFKLNIGKFPIQNPERELKVHVLQNWRWDNAYYNVQPRNTVGNFINYNTPNKVVFPAGKEFRFLDMRSTDYRSPRMLEITEYDDGFGITFYGDKKRSHSPYRSYPDSDGEYAILNTDDQLTSTRVSPYETVTNDASETNLVQELNQDYNRERVRNNGLRSEYITTSLALKSPQPLYNQDVYVMGQFCNWNYTEENKMTYDEDLKAYTVNLDLKQGFYDYVYVTVSRDDGAVSFEETEGNSFETSNLYSILVYYRGIGDRHDRLIGTRTFESYPNR